MLYAVCFGLFLPLIGFLILMSTSYVIGRKLTGIIACSTIFIAFLCFSWIAYTYVSQDLGPQSFKLYSWIPVQSINADFTLLIDPLSILMTLIITGVGFLIHLYSNGYIEHEEDYARFFSWLNLFVFFMLLLVLAQHLLVLFVGWEGVGLASYLLIGYWYHRPTAAQAATKAFVMNRIGDAAFLIGLLLMFKLFDTSDVQVISHRVMENYGTNPKLIILLTLLLFIGATGKSAQIPLQTWLPDAMEGPTPVSALIHAATMVTAGVYLIVRLFPVYSLAPETLMVIAIIGAATSLYAALCALGQTDLKRVLAYSTVSQLGLMFLAAGVGAFYAAMFHLTMHAFVKALLFLAAGNIVHMMHGTTDMRKMGGLTSKFPITSKLFLIGVLSMSAIPPLAAFFSKDLILEQVHQAGYYVLFYIGILISFLTAFYLTRAYCLTFTGTPRIEEKVLKVAKEAPRIMTTPVSILAMLSIMGGFLGYAFGKTPVLESFLDRIGIGIHDGGERILLTGPTLLSIAAAVLGGASAAYIYVKYAERLGKPLEVLRKSFYIDEIYDFLFVKPLAALSRFIDNVLEPQVFEGSITAAASATTGTARILQRIQSGQIRSYVAWMAIGTVFLIGYLVF